MKKGLFSLWCSLLSLWVVAQTAKVQVIHNSPTPGTNAGPVVDIYVNGALLQPLTAVPFRAATPFLDVPAGVPLKIEVKANPSTVADPAAFTADLSGLEANKNYSVIAAGILGNAQRPFNLYISDKAKTTSTDPAKVGITAFHGSPDAPAVDVAARNVGTLFSNVSFGGYSNSLEVAPALYYLDIKPAGTNTIAATFEADLKGLAGGAATVFASGLLGGTPAFGLYAALPDGQVVALPARSLARVQVIHNSPTPTVDVYADSIKLIDDFKFRTATPYVYLEAGKPLKLGVAPATSTSVNDVLASFNVTLQNGKTYLLFANGIVGNGQTPFRLVPFDGARETASDAQKVDVIAFHGSPIAPNVDVVNPENYSVIIPDLGYGKFSGYLSLDPGRYFLGVTETGSKFDALIYEADLRSLAGKSVTVFASGLDDPDKPEFFGLFGALADGTVVKLAEYIRAQLIHNAPAPTVDIYANGTKLIDNFAFRKATPFSYLPAETNLKIQVAPENSTSANQAIATFDDVRFNRGTTYVIMAAGETTPGSQRPFNLYLYETYERAESNSQVEINVFHGAPDAPTVDVTLPNNAVLVNDLAYGNFDYVLVPNADYRLNITPADNNNTIVASYRANLTALGGQAITVFASGYLGKTPAFGLWVALADGTTFPLANVTSTNNLQDNISSFKLFPNPGVEVINVAYTLQEASEVRVGIFDASGRTIQSSYLGKLPAGEQTFSTNVSNLSPGQYHYSIFTGQATITRPFSIVR